MNYTKQTKLLISQVYKEGFNIYQLLNKFKQEMNYEMPEQAIQDMCVEYLKYKPKIKNPWLWCKHVLTLKRDEINAQRNITEHQKTKDEPCLSLAEILRKAQDAGH